MKTLTEQIIKALDIIGPYYAGEVDLSGHGDALKAILKAVKERDAFVIGENEMVDPKKGRPEEPKAYRNELRYEQRKRAEESL